MARGTASGCDAALRPRGSARVAHAGRRRPRGRVHVGARVGHHVAEGSHMEGPRV